MENRVCVDDGVSRDLSKSEETVFEVLALNPGVPAAESVGEKYGMDEGRVSELVDSLVSKGLVRPLSREEAGEDLVWEVTELGRLRLLRMFNVMRFEVLEAEMRGQSEQELELLRRKKKGFEAAYRQCESLFGGES